MNWHAVDRTGKEWSPYILTSDNGKSNLLMHHELDDTDMGDLYMDELVEWRGPLVVVFTERTSQK